MKNRVGFTIGGMVLVGGLGIMLAMLSGGFKSPTLLAANNATPSANATATDSAQATATISIQATATASAQATVAPTAVPTTPVSTQPPQPSGQAVELKGTITSVDQEDQTFNLTRSGTTTTIKVNAGTQYSGSATSFQQIRVGSSAEIHGVWTGGIVMATEVNANG